VPGSDRPRWTKTERAGGAANAVALRRGLSEVAALASGASDRASRAPLYAVVRSALMANTGICSLNQSSGGLPRPVRRTCSCLSA
jgi:hypothetical protein